MQKSVFSMELYGRYGSMAAYVSTYTERRHRLMWHIDNLLKFQAKGVKQVRGTAIEKLIESDDMKIQRLDAEYHELAKPNNQWIFWSVN